MVQKWLLSDHVPQFWSLWNVYFQFDCQPCLTMGGNTTVPREAQTWRRGLGWRYSYSVEHTVLIRALCSLGEGKHTFLERAGKWLSHLITRGGNEIKVKFSHGITVTPFQIILVSLDLAFFFMPQDVIWIGYLICCFSEAIGCPDDSRLATSDWLLGVTTHFRYLI